MKAINIIYKNFEEIFKHFLTVSVRYHLITTCTEDLIKMRLLKELSFEIDETQSKCLDWHDAEIENSLKEMNKR